MNEELPTKRDLIDLENRLAIKLGVLIVLAIGVVALIKVL